MLIPIIVNTTLDQSKDIYVLKVIFQNHFAKPNINVALMTPKSYVHDSVASENVRHIISTAVSLFKRPAEH